MYGFHSEYSGTLVLEDQIRSDHLQVKLCKILKQSKCQDILKGHWYTAIERTGRRRESRKYKRNQTEQ